jgi:GMP synthase (glutamine-hydrolysing)
MTSEAQQPGGDQLGKPECLEYSQVVAILDGGAQYGMDIEQQIKRLGHNAIRIPFDTPIEELYKFGAVILSGGPQSVYDESSPKTDPQLFTVKDNRPPILGICYGDQLINYALGGEVKKLEKREDGYTRVNLLGGVALSSGVNDQQKFVMSHGDTITSLAPGFRAIAYSGDMIAGIANDEEKLYGVQFHPEVSPPAGPELLRNFLQDISGLEANYSYTHEAFIQDSVQEVREFVGDRQVLAYISGGVDSSALAKLLEQALPGDRVFLVLVDHGFMRDNEIEKVVVMLAESDIHVQVYDAREDYKSATTLIDGVETLPLDKVSEPEVKRKIMGDSFITIQERMAEILDLDTGSYILAMGSLYTDLIESGSELASDGAATIKTHHNDTELVRKMREAGRVLEPWRFIQKDDVRAVGKLLGLREEIYTRQPFPGPGLAIRVICGEAPYITEDSDSVATQLETFSTPDVKASLLPIQTVGVQGDGRTYAHLAGLSGKMDWPKLKELADEIPRNIHGINRVAYVFGPMINSGLDSLTPTYLTNDVKDELGVIDAIVNRKLEQYGLDKSLSQVPVILLPLHFGEPGKRSVAIRTFMTTNFKTGDIALPGVDFPEEILLEIVEEVLALPGIARVLYDLTSKPPATTEWE